MPQIEAQCVAFFDGEAPSGNGFESELFRQGTRYAARLRWDRQPSSRDMAHYSQVERAVIAQVHGAPIVRTREVAMSGSVSPAAVNAFMSTGLAPMELN